MALLSFVDSTPRAYTGSGWATPTFLFQQWAGHPHAADRQAIVAGLDQQLKRGDKALIGNSAYRRYLRTTSDRRAFEIDPGKLADEAR
jgi:hypothetical protein